jgi:hypothetical protein
MVQFRDNLELSKARCNAWWEGELIDRPPVLIHAPKRGGSPYTDPDGETLEQWWTDPGHVLPRLKHELYNTAWLGDAFPLIFPVSVKMPAHLEQYLGAPMKFVGKETTWSDSIINNWENVPDFLLCEDNHYWQQTKTLLDAAVTMIKDSNLEAFIAGPDLNGPTEVLSGLRGPQNLAMDFYDHPDKIKPALRKIQDAWFTAYEYTSNKANECGGWFTWLKVWSDIPAVDLQSDVSCLLSKEIFDEYFLPLIREQTEQIPRTLYHLDGPDAIRHMDSILSLPELNVLQWIQGAGAGPMTDWVELLQKAQNAGKSLWIACEPEEVEILMKFLKPEGCLYITDCKTEEEGLRLYERLERS